MGNCFSSEGPVSFNDGTQAGNDVTVHISGMGNSVPPHPVILGVPPEIQSQLQSSGELVRQIFSGLFVSYSLGFFFPQSC